MSPFADALRGLLKQTDYTRDEWVDYLFVKIIGEDYRPKKIALMEAWLKDEEIPRPHDLNMIWVLLEQRYAKTSAQARESFRKMADRRATEVSPLGKRMLPTVWKYMKRLVFHPVSSALAKLSPSEQEKFLMELYPEGSDDAPETEPSDNKPHGDSGPDHLHGPA